MAPEQKKKVKELKAQVQTKQDEFLEFIKGFNLEEELKKPKEEQDASRKEHAKQTQIFKHQLEDLREQLKHARMNKNGSSFFEFIPTGPNRRFRKLARKSKLV